ncbi:uncharacterized protein LOC120634955 [Pararge aegeria]|uniref:uncharacterized protein LOC120634955 n=1 Tax=Pararge aegeria TaxID=116150 RepID=UPI0019CF6C62|nr:uncharacterized protein LOC120634955 [Pararge aegeria]
MVVIAVDNIPLKMNLKEMVRSLASTVKCHFDALNFTQGKNFKTAFLRLPEKQNPNEVIKRLNNKILKKIQLRAYIPSIIPNLPLSHKTRTIPTKMRRALKIAANLSDDQLVRVSMENIVREMQTKFTGLYDLSLTTGHTLLDNIGKIVHDRLTNIVLANKLEDNCFKVTSAYRKRHPHFGDFQFIMATLHAIQDKEGKPRAMIQEKDLTTVALKELSDVPFELLKSVCNNHINRISQKLLVHVNNLEMNDETESPEVAAQMKVRSHLKRMAPYLQSFVRQVITNHFMPAQERFYIVKVYGVPYLPNKETMMPFSKKYRAVSTIRSENMYNLISLKVPAETHVQLLNADGTCISGATLVIRPSHLPIYKITRVLRSGVAIEDPQSKPGQSLKSTGNQDLAEMQWSESW